MDFLKTHYTLCNSLHMLFIKCGLSCEHEGFFYIEHTKLCQNAQDENLLNEKSSMNKFKLRSSLDFHLWKRISNCTILSSMLH